MVAQGDPVVAEPPGITEVLADDRIKELRTHLPPETFLNLVEECLLDMTTGFRRYAAH